MRGIGGMVHNNFKILDESQIKYLPESKTMWTEKLKDHEARLLPRINAYNAIPKWKEGDLFGKLMECTKAMEAKKLELGAELNSSPYHKIPVAITMNLELAQEEYDKHIAMKRAITGGYEGVEWGYHELSESAKIAFLQRYFDIPPLPPHVMINISPDWKGKEITTPMIREFKGTITDYFNEMDSNRYSKYTYVLENGGEGDHLHAHIVACINPDYTKSTETHISKRKNHSQIRKHWKRHFTGKGVQGALDGKFAIQTNILRNEKLIEDKSKYLYNENKPVGHENKSEIMSPVTIDFS